MRSNLPIVACLALGFLGTVELHRASANTISEGPVVGSVAGSVVGGVVGGVGGGLVHPCPSQASRAGQAQGGSAFRDGHRGMRRCEGMVGGGMRCVAGERGRPACSSAVQAGDPFTTRLPFRQPPTLSPAPLPPPDHPAPPAIPTQMSSLEEACDGPDVGYLRQVGRSCYEPHRAIDWCIACIGEAVLLKMIGDDEHVCIFPMSDPTRPCGFCRRRRDNGGTDAACRRVRPPRSLLATAHR